MAKVLHLLEKMGFVERSGGPDEMLDPVSGVPSQSVTPEPTGTSPEPEVRKIRTPRLDAAFEAAATAEHDDHFPISKIYASAGIEEPEHGFTVYTLLDMMDAEEFSGLDDATRAKVLSGILRRLPSGSVSMEDIVDDAARRDQALDAFESFLQQRVETTERELDAANRELQEEIDAVTRRNSELIENNRQTVADERQRLAVWREHKRAEENRLFEAIEPFVTANPVSVSEDGGDDPGES